MQVDTNRFDKASSAWYWMLSNHSAPFIPTGISSRDVGTQDLMVLDGQRTELGALPQLAEAECHIRPAHRVNGWPEQWAHHWASSMGL